MAETKSAITVTDAKDASNLQELFAKVKNIYYNDAPITQASFSTGIECEMEFPVIENSVTLNTGDADKTEIKLTTGAIWVSRATKGDSDISFQIASISDTVSSLFLTKKTGKNVTGISINGLTGQFSGESYSLDLKKATGSLVMTDDNGQTVIILTNVEMYGGFVAGEGDNPAYFNVKVTPRDNSDGAALMILRKTA